MDGMRLLPGGRHYASVQCGGGVAQQKPGGKPGRYDGIVCVSGDGMLHEVINGLAVTR